MKERSVVHVRGDRGVGQSKVGVAVVSAYLLDGLLLLHLERGSIHWKGTHVRACV